MRVISKIPIKPLNQEVADRIRKLILTGMLKTGEHIVETEMCASLGISRTPFREGLKILSSEGLVDLVPNRGAYVVQHSEKEIREMFQVMSILEGACARIAVEKMTKSAFKHLESAHHELEIFYEAGDLEQYMTVNDNYHVFVQEMAGNKVLDGVINGLRHKILLYRHLLLLLQPDRFLLSIREHRNLLEAFRKRDADAAEASMKLHLLNQCESMVVHFDRQNSRSDCRKRN